MKSHIKTLESRVMILDYVAAMSAVFSMLALSIGYAGNLPIFINMTVALMAVGVLAGGCAMQQQTKIDKVTNRANK